MVQSRKIVCKKLSTNFRECTEIVKFELPTLKNDQVLVQVKCVGINASDINYTNGAYLPGVQPPFDCGFEAVGVVVEVGPGVKKLKKGDAVASMSYGAFAEHIVIKERLLIKVPAAVPAILPITVCGLTASMALEYVGQMTHGETVLITAAAGATGQFAVQLAKLAGNHVIGTCSSPDKVEYLKSIGCDRPINYREENVFDVLKKEYPRGVDLVFESVGGEMFETCVNNIAKKGRIIVIGAIAGYQDSTTWKHKATKVTTPLPSKLLAKSASVRGFFLNDYFHESQQHTKKLSMLVQRGLLNAGVDPSNFFGLEDVPNAIDYMYERKNIGKLVVDLTKSNSTARFDFIDTGYDSDVFEVEFLFVHITFICQSHERMNIATTPMTAAADATREAEDLATLETYRVKSDGVATKTYMDQLECEQSCGMFFFPLRELPEDQQLQLQQSGFTNAALEPLLMREKHVDFLKRGLLHLSSGFVALDASRPWICYWILHALELLDALPVEYIDRTISTIKHFWHEEGGFGGGPAQLGHTATNYASCLTLALIGTPEALDIVDRQALYRFFMKRKHASGAFTAHDGGEVDVRVTYCVISIASLYGILTEELTKGVVEYVVACQSYEGGFGGEPGNEAHGGYAFCAVATLWILKSLHRMDDLPAFVQWLANRQMPFEGGYQGRTNKLVDGCYSFWQGALPALLVDILEEQYDHSVYQCHQAQLQKYILLCGQQIEGGLRDKPGKPRDHYHSCYCLSGLSVTQHGSGKGEPVVFGDASNLLVATHPAYNISRTKAESTLAYFAAKGPFQP